MLARWNPWQELSDLEREMSDLTRRFFGTGSLAPSTRGSNGGMWTPAVDVFTGEGDLVGRAELPGVDPGQPRFEEESERHQLSPFESYYGPFQRNIPLPDGVKADDVQATHENGTLE